MNFNLRPSHISSGISLLALFSLAGCGGGSVMLQGPSTSVEAAPVATGVDEWPDTPLTAEPVAEPVAAAPSTACASQVGLASNPCSSAMYCSPGVRNPMDHVRTPPTVSSSAAFAVHVSGSTGAIASTPASAAMDR